MMREYFTEALVLGSKPSGQNDKIVDLYTKDFGRIQAKVVGGRKLASKLSPHLEEANLVEVRLVEKNQFTLADVMVKEKIAKNYSVFDILFLLKSLTPQLVPDLLFWHSLVRSLKQKKVSSKLFLKFLGYNPLLARCENCKNKEVNYFSITNQTFLCKRCFSKIPLSMTDKILFLN